MAPYSTVRDNVLHTPAPRAPARERHVFGRVCATVAAMVLLSRMIRTAAVTGRTDTVSAWFGGRQGGRWAEQTVRAALRPAGRPAQGTPAAARDPAPTDPAETLRELTELHTRGVVTDAEFETLRADLRI
jgi:hypothetical protein